MAIKKKVEPGLVGEVVVEDYILQIRRGTPCFRIAFMPRRSRRRERFREDYITRKLFISPEEMEAILQILRASASSDDGFVTQEIQKAFGFKPKAGCHGERKSYCIF